MRTTLALICGTYRESHEVRERLRSQYECLVNHSTETVPIISTQQLSSTYKVQIPALGAKCKGQNRNETLKYKQRLVPNLESQGQLLEKNGGFGHPSSWFNHSQSFSWQRRKTAHELHLWR